MINRRRLKAETVRGQSEVLPSVGGSFGISMVTVYLRSMYPLPLPKFEFGFAQSAASVPQAQRFRPFGSSQSPSFVNGQGLSRLLLLPLLEQSAVSVPAAHRPVPIPGSSHSPSNAQLQEFASLAAPTPEQSAVSVPAAHNPVPIPGSSHSPSKAHWQEFGPLAVPPPQSAVSVPTPQRPVPIPGSSHSPSKAHGQLLSAKAGAAMNSPVARQTAGKARKRTTQIRKVGMKAVI